MQWLLVAAVAGGLFIAFAAVDWALTRLDSENEKSARSAGFLGVGLVCLAVAGAFSWINRGSAVPALAPAAQPASLSLDEDVAQLEKHMDEWLFLAQKVADGAYPSNLSAILTARSQLHAARIALSHRPYPGTAASTLHSQSDIVLNAAYQTLGIQWILVKQGLWATASDRETALGPLRREMAKWYTIRDCLNSGATDCGSTTVTDPKHLAIRDFIGWFQPYLLELNRFQESDLDLMIGTPEELSRLRALVGRARQELKTARRDSWDQRMVKATDTMLAAAETALDREAKARAANSWTQDELERTNAPVVAAFENMMTAMFEAR